MRDLGNYFVMLQQKFSDFFRNREAKLIFESKPLSYVPSHINRFALAFLLNLWMSFQNSLKDTLVGAALEIDMFYLSSSSQTFQK